MMKQHPPHPNMMVIGMAVLVLCGHHRLHQNLVRVNLHLHSEMMPNVAQTAKVQRARVTATRAKGWARQRSFHTHQQQQVVPPPTKARARARVRARVGARASINSTFGVKIGARTRRKNGGKKTEQKMRTAGR